MRRKNGHFVVGVRLTIEISDPGDAPFGVIGVFAAGKIFEDALVIVDGIGAVEQHPIVVAGGHQGFFGPMALRIFLRDFFDVGEHLGFVFFRTIGLRERVETLGIGFRIAGVQIGQQSGRRLGMLAAFGGANQSTLARGIRGIFQHGGELFVFDAGFFPFVRVVENLRALVLKFGRGVRKFVVELLVEARKRERGVLGFVGQGKLVVKRLIILRGVDEFASGFVGARTREEQRRLSKKRRDKRRARRDRPAGRPMSTALGA